MENVVVMVGRAAQLRHRGKCRAHSGRIKTLVNAQIGFQFFIELVPWPVPSWPTRTLVQ